MTWSASATLTRDDNTGNVDVTNQNLQPQSGHGRVESEHAIKRAIDAAVSFVASGALGYGSFHVALNGHSNPGNKPHPQFSNDYVNIAISQRSPEPAAPTQATPTRP